MKKLKKDSVTAGMV